MSTLRDAIDRMIELVEQARGPQPLEGSLAVIPSGMRIEDTERALPQRSRFRGRYRTGSLSAFVAYIAARRASIGHSAPVRVFVEHDKLGATAFFNLGNEEVPGHGDDVAILDMPLSPEYEALCSFPRVLSQELMVDWMRDWAHAARFATCVVDGEGAETLTVIPSGRAIAAVRALQIKKTDDATHELGELSLKRTRLEEVEASSRLQLPTLILLNFAPAEGLSPQNAQLRISLAGTDQPTFRVRPVALATLKEVIAKDFETSLGCSLAVAGVVGVEIFRGTFSP